MAIQGAVADRVRALIPVTWDALENDPRVGDSTLQSSIDFAKDNTTGTVVPPSQEDLYAVAVVDYIAKIAIIQIANTAIDYWMNQALSVSSTGTNENLSYVDRAAYIEQVRTQYLLETRENYLRIAKIVQYWLDNGESAPQLSSATINPFHLTPSPEEFPRPFKQTQYS
jgi:hypothetical protein